MQLRQKENRTAAAATELAVLLPFIGFMFVVAVDFCRIFHVTQTVESCAHVAALHASGNCTWQNTTYGEPQSGGGITGAVSGLLDRLLIPEGESAADFAPFVYAARQAAVAEGQSLHPPVKAEDVAIAYQPGLVSVTVRYRFHMITPLLGRERLVKRSVSMPVMPQPVGSPSPLNGLLKLF